MQNQRRHSASGLVDLLDGGAAGAAGGTAGCATGHAALGHATAAGRLVDLHHDGVHCTADSIFSLSPPSNLSFIFSSFKVLRMVKQ